MLMAGSILGAEIFAKLILRQTGMAHCSAGPETGLKRAKIFCGVMSFLCYVLAPLRTESWKKMVPTSRRTKN
jgi:hypothetical protein